VADDCCVLSKGVWWIKYELATNSEGGPHSINKDVAKCNTAAAAAACLKNLSWYPWIYLHSLSLEGRQTSTPLLLLLLLLLHAGVLEAQLPSSSYAT
jgi:hypothetical protein